MNAAAPAQIDSGRVLDSRQHAEHPGLADDPSAAQHQHVGRSTGHAALPTRRRCSVIPKAPNGSGSQYVNSR